jgi:hypothetical protein
MSTSFQSVQSNNVSSMTQNQRPQDDINNYMYMFMDCADLVRLYPSDWNSLYISNLPVGIHSAEAVSEIVQTLFCIGKVSRVDIISSPSYKGGVYISAFIHFEYWYKTGNAEHLRNSINQSGKCDIYGYYNQTFGKINYTDTHDRTIYFRFSKNTTPIPEIQPNTIQIVENLAIAVKKINYLEEKIAKMQEQLTDVICNQIQSQKPTYDPEMGEPEYYREYDCDNDYNWDQSAFRADQQEDYQPEYEWKPENELQQEDALQQEEYYSNDQETGSDQDEEIQQKECIHSRKIIHDFNNFMRMDNPDKSKKYIWKTEQNQEPSSKKLQSLCQQPSEDQHGKDEQLYTDQTVVECFTSEQKDPIFECEKCKRIDQLQYTGSMPFPNSIQENGLGWASYHHDRPMNVCEFCATCQYHEWSEFCVNAFIELPENENHDNLCDVCEETKQSMKDEDYAFVHNHGGYVDACISGYARNLAKYVNVVSGIMVCEDCPLPKNGFIKNIRKK